MNKTFQKKRAPLNRTIVLNDEDIKKYSGNFIYLTKKASAERLKNKIINQNLFDAIDYIPDNFVDLLFIDPPYNLSKKYNSTSFKEMKSEQYEKWFDSWFGKIIKILKDDASVYICSDWQSSQPILNVAGKYLKLRNRICWEREKGRGAKKNWKNCTEDIWFFTNSDSYTFNINNVKLRRLVLAPYRDKNNHAKDWKQGDNGKYRDTYPSNIWTDISIPFWSMPENTDHPAQKPEKLLAKIILASSNKGDLIFDPFLGSGTSAVVAKKLGRNFTAVETDKYYCAIAYKRLQLAGKDKSIQGFEDGVFWERNTFKYQKKIK